MMLVKIALVTLSGSSLVQTENLILREILGMISFYFYSWSTNERIFHASGWLALSLKRGDNCCDFGSICVE